MNENFSPNNSENEDSNLNKEESDYDNLIIRLKKIKKTFALFEKIIFK